MTSKKTIRVIFDTNVWISFLIGKRLTRIKQHIINGDIQLIVTNQLLNELRVVTSREKLKSISLKIA
ncbi:putative toxin-antitoxin system toxin component, PIN family [Pseudopedobacter beijingensis]|uniref:Toxin-antitoxin system toxin component, PIN family n=1 Tax=Pseudopedobacter beijingensis TaxID=1207056 RepID=A0ABW4IHP8_9SPHI